MKTISGIKASWKWVVLLAAVGAGCGGSGSGTEQGWHLNEARTSSPASDNGATATAAAAQTDNDFVIQMPLGVERNQITLAASDRVLVGKGAKITEAGIEQFGALSGASIETGAGSAVGNLYSTGSAPVLVADGATVHGFIKAGSTIVKAPSAQIDLGTMENVDRQTEQYRWTVGFPRTPGPDQTAAAGSAVDLPARPFGHVVVERGATLVLHSGAYYFESLDVQPQAIVEIDNNNGPVYLWVRASLGMSGTTVLYSDKPNVFVGYAGTAAPRIESAFHGTLVAPRADVTLPKVAQAHSGAFFAHSISVADGAAVEHQAFQPGDVDYSAAPDEGCYEAPYCYSQPSASALSACYGQFSAQMSSCSTNGIACGVGMNLSCSAFVSMPPVLAACMAAVTGACSAVQASCETSAGASQQVCINTVPQQQTCSTMDICPE